MRATAIQCTSRMANIGGHLMRGRAFICAVLAAACLPSLPMSGSADYRVCNDARFTSFSAIAYEDKEKGLVTVGWFEVKRGKCETLITGSLKGRASYHTAEALSAEGVKLFWPSTPQPSDQTFCVGQQQTQASLSTRRTLRVAAKRTITANGNSSSLQSIWMSLRRLSFSGGLWLRRRKTE